MKNKFILTTLNEFLSDSLILIRGVGKNDTGSIDLFGRGLYLTDDEEVAKHYGDIIKTYNVKGKIFDTTKPFTSIELKKFYLALDKVLKSNLGSKYFKELVDVNDGEIPTDVDYIGISWALNSYPEFRKLLVKNKLDLNQENTYADDCTAMNLALKELGYIGLKYSTSEIEDLDDKGLGNRNAFLIFDNNVAKEVK